MRRVQYLKERGALVRGDNARQVVAGLGALIREGIEQLDEMGRAIMAAKIDQYAEWADKEFAELDLSDEEIAEVADDESLYLAEKRADREAVAGGDGGAGGPTEAAGGDEAMG